MISLNLQIIHPHDLWPTLGSSQGKSLSRQVKARQRGDRPKTQLAELVAMPLTLERNQTISDQRFPARLKPENYRNRLLGSLRERGA